MSMNSSEKKQFILTGKHVLAMALAFFGVIVAVEITFVVISLSTFNGVSETNAYYKGREYNTTLAKARTQAALGWTVKASYAAPLFEINARKDDLALNGLSGQIMFSRQVVEGFDTMVPISFLGDGRYQAVFAPDQKGRWHASITLQSTEGSEFQQEIDLWVK